MVDFFEGVGMRSVQLRGYRGAVHTVGVTSNGILYIDIQKFSEDAGDDATTYYVRAADVLRIKRIAAHGRINLLTDVELVKLFGASFHSAEYVLEWLDWAQIPTVRRFDEGSRYNAEEHIPQEALTGSPGSRAPRSRDSGVPSLARSNPGRGKLQPPG